MAQVKEKKPDVFGCEVAINGGTYYLSPLDKSQSPVLDFLKGFRLEKQDPKRPGVYDVVQTRIGFECDCQDFQIRRGGQDSTGCKHLRAMFHFGFFTREAPRPVPVPVPWVGPAVRSRTTARNVFPE